MTEGYISRVEVSNEVVMIVSVLCCSAGSSDVVERIPRESSVQTHPTRRSSSLTLLFYIIYIIYFTLLYTVYTLHYYIQYIHYIHYVLYIIIYNIYIIYF